MLFSEACQEDGFSPFEKVVAKPLLTHNYKYVGPFSDQCYKGHETNRNVAFVFDIGVISSREIMELFPG